MSNDDWTPEQRAKINLANGDGFHLARILVEMNYLRDTLPDGLEDDEDYCVAFDFRDGEVQTEAYSILVNKLDPTKMGRVSVLDNWEKFSTMEPVSTPYRRRDR